jgi:hypothetical protein
MGISSVYIDFNKADEWSRTPDGLKKLEFWNKIQKLYVAGRITSVIVETAVTKALAGKTVIQTEEELNTFKNEINKTYPDSKIDELLGKEISNLIENRFIRNIEDFKSAIAKGENVFYVGKHSDITPRPTGINGIAESHHGVNSVWMKEKYLDYGSGNNAPTVYMLKAPNHNATRGEFNRWSAEIRAKQGTTQIDYSKVTNEEILNLANRQFDVADVPQAVRDEYFRLWNAYIKTLTIK